MFGLEELSVAKDAASVEDVADPTDGAFDDSAASQDTSRADFDDSAPDLPPTDVLAGSNDIVVDSTPEGPDARSDAPG
jgi:hypothetical protein